MQSGNAVSKRTPLFGVVCAGIYSVAVLSRKTKIGARRYSSVATDDIVLIGSTERVMTLTTSLRSENAVVK